MSLLLSLYCRQGVDTVLRFILIQCISVVALVLLTLVSSNIVLFTVFWLLLFSIDLLSIKRRLNGTITSHFKFYLPTILYFLMVMLTAFTEYYLLLWLSFFYLSSLLLIVKIQPNSKQLTHSDFILGYSGPVDLSPYQQQQSKVPHTRIEPIFSSQQQYPNIEPLLPVEQIASQQNPKGEQQRSTPLNSSSPQPLFKHLSALIPNGILNRVNIIIGITFVFSCLFIFIFNPTASTPDENIVIKAVEQPPILEHNFPLPMPSGFTLYFSKNNALIVAWPSTNSKTSEIWSLTSGLGDKQCANLSFNKKLAFRPLQVTDNGQGEYFALFSPIDTKKLLQAIAFKNKFTLCGNSFSLSGSQATIGKNSHYANYIDY